MLTNAQIITLACQIAKCPGMTSQAGQLYNSILDDLCQTYNIDAARTTIVFNFSGSGGGTGPNVLPANYLRADEDEVFWTLNGVPYPLISMDLAEYDALVRTAGFQSFPTHFATDMSKAPPEMFIWPPANGAYPCTLRYFQQMPTIASPELSAAAPWFPNATYLKTQLTGMLCQITGDDRADGFLSDNDEMHPNGAGVQLRKYLKMQGDPLGRAKTVQLDRRRFGRNFATLRNTKQVGW